MFQSISILGGLFHDYVRKAAQQREFALSAVVKKNAFSGLSGY
jgi:hypothetical protein